MLSSEGGVRARTPIDLCSLRARLEAVSGRGHPGHTNPVLAPIPLGVPEIDRSLTIDGAPGGLSPGAVHEWIGLADASGSAERCTDGFRPLTMLLHLARQAVRARGSSASVLWIGRRCWPCPTAMVGTPGVNVLERSVFVDARAAEERVWATDLSLRARGTAAAVVADGSGLSLSMSRRLQLAAAAGGALCLLARPARDLRELSAARTRWLLAPVPPRELPPESPTSPSPHVPRWTVHLLRCKGLRPAPESARRWAVQHDHATGTLRLVPGLPDRPAAATGPPSRRTA